MKISGFFKSFFKKKTLKNPKKSLKQALELGMITAEEFLRLTKDRAVDDYENFCEVQQIKPKK